MRRILTIYNAILAALLSLLGCHININSPDEYGTPSADFIISGKALSSDGGPAPNIAVVMSRQLGADSEGRALFDVVDSTGTGSSGDYRVASRGTFPEDQVYRLTFSDADGAANGAFKDTTVMVEFINPEFTGGSGSWYSGEASKEVNIQLRPEE